MKKIIIWILSFTCHASYALYKIDLCEIEIENTSDDLLTIQYQPIQDRIVIQQNGNFTQIQGRPTTPRIVSETLPPKSETIVQFDCIPSFANIQLSTIHDIDNNEIVKNFGLKSGNAYSVIRHASGHHYVKRLHQSTTTSATVKKLRRDIKITRHNNLVYRKLNEDLKIANETNSKLIIEYSNLKTGLIEKNDHCKNKNEALKKANEQFKSENEKFKEENKRFETEINESKWSNDNLTDEIDNCESRLSHFETIFSIDLKFGILRCNGAVACNNPTYLTALCYLSEGGDIVETTFEYWVSRLNDDYKCLPCCILGEDIHPKMKTCSSMPSASDIIKQQALHGRCGIDFDP